MLLSDVTDVIVDLHLVGGVLINILLLYAIRRFSRQLMGTYKYLLASFASFHGFLSIAHHFVRPIVVIHDTIFAAVTDGPLKQDTRLTGAFAAFYTVPFTLMNIHFLYRFWSFLKFIAFIVAIPIVDFVTWYLICMSGEVDAAGTLRIRNEFERRYGKVLEDGWLLVNFAEEDGHRARALATMIAFDVVMIGSFTIAVTLATLTYKYISKADKMSSQTLHLQYKLLIAVCAQTLVPVIFVYLPYLGVNHLAFLRLQAHSIDSACMQLTACFPMWDAIIIVALIKDYRDGLLSIVRPTKAVVKVETTWMTMAVTEIPPTTA